MLSRFGTVVSAALTLFDHGVPRAFVAAALVLAATSTLFASDALAQATRTPDDTLDVAGRSSFEEGYLGFVDLNRTITGPRALGMGGTGIAVDGGLSYLSINPAQLLGMRAWEVSSEMAFLSGSGSVSSFPDRLAISGEISLESSNYRSRPVFASGYNELSAGLPLVLLGKRGALAVSYRRIVSNPQGDETRFEVVGPITNNIPATTGVGTEPDGGFDAITVGVAREMTGSFDFGFNLNFSSGEIRNKTEIGASVFGQRVTGGGSRFDQNMSSISLDLGGKLELSDRLSVGATAYLGHDVKFKSGNALNFPLPDAQDPNSPVLMIRTDLLDHTLSLPTAFGFGLSYQVNDRLSVAADYWLRPWSNAEITRPEIDPILFFGNPDDSLSFGFVLDQGTGDETFNARLDDANSLRVGAEYLLHEGQTLKVPVRLGFRSEKLTTNNIAVDAPYDDYVGLISDYWRYVAQEQTPPEGSDIDPDQIEEDLESIIEFKQLVFQGDAVQTTTISLGLGFHIRNFAVELGGQSTSYDIDRFFFQSFDPLLTPFADKTEESRRVSTLTVKTSMRF